MKKWFFLFLLGLTAIWIGKSVFTNSYEEGNFQEVLTVGTNAEYPPYCYIDENKIVGFDIDVAKEVAKRLQKKLVLCDMPFDALIPALKLHKIDCIAAGLTPTVERLKNVFFTKPYLAGDPLVIVSFAGHPLQDLDALKGKHIAVNEGYASDLYLSEIQGIELIRLPSPSDGFLALASHKVDAFVTVQTTAHNFMQQYPQNSYVLSNIGNISEGVAVALAKDRPKELQEIDAVLEQMTQDQTIENLQKKWGFL
ncbi:MAG: ABC transporter substrate-binding protein [Rhabdochlamydiaceae bacterium]|nr:ABC transporter substrate-binding protein [Rhabdochlamydiaceae bacterium]